MMTASPPVIVLKGDLDVRTSSKLREAVGDLNEPATLDLTAVRHIDATALGILATVARRVGIGRLTLIVPRGTVTRMMKLVGFPSLCRVITDRRETSILASRLARRRTDAMSGAMSGAEQTT